NARSPWNAALVSLATSAGLGCERAPWIIASEASDAALGADDAGADETLSTEGCPSAAALRGAGRSALGVPAVSAQHVGVWRGTLGGSAALAFPASDLTL